MEEIYQCEVCRKPITKGVYNYSINSFMKKSLCIACQLKFKSGLYEKNNRNTKSNI